MKAAPLLPPARTFVSEATVKPPRNLNVITPLLRFVTNFVPLNVPRMRPRYLFLRMC